MNVRKIILASFVATLGASFMHQASAQWGTGGATKIPRKSHLTNLDLFCDLSRVSFGGDTIAAANRVKIVTSPSATSPSDPASLTFSGELFCAEVNPGNSGLENAVVHPSRGPLVGRFELIQRSPAQRPTSTLTQTETGLVFDFNAGTGVRTWTFLVPPGAGPYPPFAYDTFPFPELLYDLAPADAATAAKFCESGANDCKALIGLQLPARQSDYQPKDLDGDATPDLDLGEVFKFRTKTTGGNEVPGAFFWAPCHSQAFGTPQTFVVKALENALVGMAVDTGITVANGSRLAVTVNQNDLWNTGPLSPGCSSGRCYFWSNADGVVRTMYATGHDDSQTNPTGAPNPGQQIGMDRRLFNNSYFGYLTGSFDGANFFVLGTAFDGPAPANSGGTLKLYNQDTINFDNSESVEVTVATESIQCKDANGQPAVALGNARGERRVEVRTNPGSLNVSNKSSSAAFPITILGCDIGDAAITFGPHGSPIALGTQVLVNGMPVGIKHASVENKSTGPASCNSSGATLPDLQLQLNRLQFINAVVGPSGKCQDGPTGYSLALGNATDGFYGGQDTVSLNNCKKLK